MNPFRRRIQTAMQQGGGAVAFNPTDIAGLQLWLDASQIVGLNDGDPVATWSDLSGNANNATQATASNKPTYKTNQINSRPVVRFDGVDDFMTYANQLFTFTGDATVFAVLKVATVTAGYYPAIVADFTGGLSSCAVCPQVYPNGSVEFCTDVYSPGGVRANSTDSTATAYLLTVAWQDWQNHKTNGQTTIRVNGVAKTVAAYGNGPASLPGGTRLIGSFDMGGASSKLNGDIAALLVYNARLSAGDIALVETYLDGLYNP